MKYILVITEWDELETEWFPNHEKAIGFAIMRMQCLIMLQSH